MDRRRYLQAAGSALTVSLLAGCSDTLSDLETEEPARDDPVDLVGDPPDIETTSTPTPDRSGEPTTSEPDESGDLNIPIHLMELSGSTDPDLDAEDLEFKDRTYTQEIDWFGQTELSTQIPTNLYKYYKSRTRIGEYGAYVSDSYDDSYIADVVGAFEEWQGEDDRSDLETINHMIGFVQNLEYSSDEVATGYNNYPKFPIETLVDKGGDCEDTAILLASMLEEFGYGTVLLGLFDRNHMALGIYGEEGIEGTYYETDGRRYYYVETTAPGWQIGEAPDDMRGANADLIQINSHPVLVFQYSVSPKPGGVDVDCSIRNVGDALASAASLRIIFEKPNGRTVSADRTGDLLIPPEETVSETLDMSVPDDQPLRIKARCALGNTLHDELVTDVARPS